MVLGVSKMIPCIRTLAMVSVPAVKYELDEKFTLKSHSHRCDLNPALLPCPQSAADVSYN